MTVSRVRFSIWPAVVAETTCTVTLPGWQNRSCRARDEDGLEVIESDAVLAADADRGYSPWRAALGAPAKGYAEIDLRSLVVAVTSGK